MNQREQKREVHPFMRRKTKEICAKIVELLSVSEFKSTSQLATEIETHPQTVEAAIDLILMIQAMPRVISETMSGGKLLVRKEKELNNEDKQQ